MPLFVGALPYGNVPKEEGKRMKLSSPVFESERSIPNKYSCYGANINPPLRISDIPAGTKTLALILEDLDAPRGTFVHWLVYNIPVDNRIEEGSVPGTQGVNNFRKRAYGGPCPPSGTHRYVFKLYALNTVLALGEGADRKRLEAAMEGHIVDTAELMGLYQKKSGFFR
ncbi:MAG: YbhB/YbcL family Raf kinase inhibitor-like protein [Methanomicrobia archaeon]|nr:YbhB/YbcL family Raf kinase inhibitor-like protein [Methanomicrobia archaeon]